MNVLFYDTETTGLPKNWYKPMTDLDNWPRVIQLAWMLTDGDGRELSRGNKLIQPDGWVVPTGEFWVSNGFTHANSLANGEPMKSVIPQFAADLDKAEYLVSHNRDFDKNTLGAEMIRYGFAFKEVEAICTKEEGTDFCKLPAMFGGYKWPKLIELHKKLFGKGFDGAHDALADVIACKDCFFELVKRGVITLRIDYSFDDLL